MDFDLDDPLDDILKSDNSTDSFFGGKKAKAPVKSATATKSDDKQRMSNLFGIKEPEPELPEPIPQSTTAAPVATRPKSSDNPPVPVRAPAIKKKEVSFDDDDDNSTSDLGFDPKKAKAKTNLFDDLLAPRGKPNRPKTAVAEIKPIAEDTPSRPQTASHGSSPKKSIKDPLGLFFSDKPVAGKETIKADTKPTNLDWLGMDSKKAGTNVPKEPNLGQSMTQIKPPPNVLSSAAVASVIVQEPTPTLMSIPLSSDAVLLDALQRQESQLTMTTQMKQQESLLMDMQQRQKALLQQQESKFQELIQNQINRQAHLEGTIRTQQNRINVHLQNLMNQPLDVPQGDNMNPHRNEDGAQDNKKSTLNRDEELIGLHNEVKRLELEKLRFEDLFSNATAIHEQEISFIDLSHKKQIQLLEDQLQQIEERLKQENKTLEEFYKRKLNLLEADKQETIDKYEKKLAEFKEDSMLTINNLKANHQATVEELKLDQQKAISHLKDSKLMELSQFEDRFSYLDHLKSAAKYMETATGDIESLRVTINERIETIHKDKERELERREKRVEVEQRHLETIQETAQNEQKRLLDLVHSLENKLTTLAKESSEDQWVVRQKLATLEAERSAFEREQSYFREQHKRDERRIEELKEATLREQSVVMEELAREKEKLAEDKVKFVTLQRLNESKPSNLSNNQHEVEIAIQVAKEAARQSDVERDNWMTRQRQCELKKREIVEYEQQIRRKETEMEVMLNAAREREQKAENFIRNAKMMEQKVVGKYQELTRNAQDLVERERKLSEEKQSLSRERMELQALQQKKDDDRCNFCKSGLMMNAPAERDQAENFNYNELSVGLVSGVDMMFSQELNAILKQVPQMDNFFM